MSTPRRRPPAPGRAASLIAVTVLLIAVALALWQLVPWRRPAPPDVPAEPVPGVPAIPTEPAVPTEPAAPVPRDPVDPPLPAPTTPAPAARGRVAIVIDDFGRSLAEVEAAERLGVPLTYAVLPFESRTAEVAAALEARGREVLCHLPMEPGNGADPGPGALTATMGRGELVRATRAALAAVPGAVGANNHMGSRLSADRRAMRVVLGVLGDERLFFVDSRTSAESVAYATARRLGVAAARRHVFLDGDRRPEAIRAQFARLLDEAARRGAAIAIGHPYPETFAVLGEEIPAARAAGFEFVPVSFLLDAAGGPPR